ncbi:MAG: type VII toxin-antitoxin system HepT family RNase toxin [Egibacteraceae bacterium]
MTPAAFRPEAVQRRLVEIDRLLTVLETQGHMTEPTLDQDDLLRLAVERALTQIVDLAVKINTHVVTASGQLPPSDYHQSFTRAAEVELLDASLAEELSASTGLRNRLIHEYDDIDLSIVAAALPRAISGYRRYVRQVADYLRRRQDDA